MAGEFILCGPHQKPVLELAVKEVVLKAVNAAVDSNLLRCTTTDSSNHCARVNST